MKTLKVKSFLIKNRIFDVLLFSLLLILTFFILMSGFINEVYASGKPLQELPGVQTPGQGAVFFTYIGGIINLLIGVAAVLAIIFVAIGGAQYVTIDSMSGKEGGKETITSALLGLMLVLASWLVLYTINPALLSFNLNPGVPPDVS